MSRTKPTVKEALIYYDIGLLIKQARRAQGISQAVLAERCALTRGSIANIELANQHVPIHTLWGIARALDLHPLDLLPDSRGIVLPIKHTWRRRISKWLGGKNK